MCEPVHKNGLNPLSRAALKVYTIAARIKRLGFRCYSAKQRFQPSQPKVLPPSRAAKCRFGGRRRRRSKLAAKHERWWQGLHVGRGATRGRPRVIPV